MKHLFFGALCLLLLCSCDKDEANIEDFDLVKTIQDEEYWSNSENAPKTYYLKKDVTWLEKDGVGNSNPIITRKYDTTIVASIEKNMEELGYTKISTIDDQNQPDLLIAVQALATSFNQVDFIWDSWYSWWDIYDPFYPLYPGAYPVYYEWTEGTIIIEIGDYKSLNKEEESIDIVWVAGINGLVRSTQTGNMTFIEERINDAFKQSLYLEVE